MDVEATNEPPQPRGCPPIEQWPVVANMRIWSKQPNEERWKRIRKCPHCGVLREEIQSASY